MAGTTQLRYLLEIMRSTGSLSGQLLPRRVPSRTWGLHTLTLHYVNEFRLALRVGKPELAQFQITQAV